MSLRHTKSIVVFRRSLASKLQIHSRSITVRGSSKLGFSTCPRVEKAWRAIHDNSDIDIAIADVDYFDRVFQELEKWKRYHSTECYDEQTYEVHLRREKLLSHFCINDSILPSDICTWHYEAMKSIRLENHCGQSRNVNAFMYREWKALRNRWILDIRQLCQRVDDCIVAAPPDHPWR